MPEDFDYYDYDVMGTRYSRSPFGRQLEDQRWVDPGRTRTKQAHPYSYDEFFIFGSRALIKKEGVRGDYSDRLWEWGPDKFEGLWKKHVGKRWDQASEAQLSAFMSEYHGERLTVVALAEGCNPSNGYPYWVVWCKGA